MPPEISTSPTEGRCRSCWIGFCWQCPPRNYSNRSRCAAILQESRSIFQRRRCLAQFQYEPIRPRDQSSADPFWFHPSRAMSVGGWRYRSASYGECHGHYGAGLDSQLPCDPPTLDAGLDACGGTQAAAGLEVGSPMVDLAGFTPSLVYVLETRALDLPWVLGGYPGSNAVAVETRGLENCTDLAKAWVPIEPEGPFRLDDNVMASFGARPAGYVIAAAFAPESRMGSSDLCHAIFAQPICPAACGAILPRSQARTSG
ncbi:hypothetical protein ABIA45_007387 [Bradyrhizobium sp. USDA 336]